MLGILPAGFATALAFIGLAAPPIVGWAAPFAPLAPYLFTIAIILIVIAHARCGWQPAGFAAVGGFLIYLAMYMLVTPAEMNTMGGTGDTRPPMPDGAWITNTPLFYIHRISVVR